MNYGYFLYFTLRLSLSLSLLLSLHLFEWILIVVSMCVAKGTKRKINEKHKNGMEMSLCVASTIQRDRSFCVLANAPTTAYSMQQLCIAHCGFLFDLIRSLLILPSKIRFFLSIRVACDTPNIANRSSISITDIHSTSMELKSIVIAL